MLGLYNHNILGIIMLEEGTDMVNLVQFEKQKYLNIETYRKNGVGVKTPVWFALEFGNVYIYTEAHTWKMKRVRNNSRVRIAPCKFNGDVLGEWIDAEAAIVTDDALRQHIDALLTSKYGLLKRFFDLLGRFSKGEKGYLHVTPD